MNVFRSMKKRKGFSLVELIVVILIIAILAVAVFAGGSAAIKKSQVARTTSDLHNFSIAIESAMNETPSVANMKADTITGAVGDMQKIVDQVNANLSADYQLVKTAVTADISSNLEITDGASYIILESEKTDAWGNHYYAIFDYGERHAQGQSDFFITVVSAGPNAQTNVGGNIEGDDIFLLVQYSDGDVSAVTYNCAEGNLLVSVDADDDPAALGSAFTVDVFNKNPGPNKTLTVKGVAGTMLYAGGADNTEYSDSVLPVNF